MANSDLAFRSAHELLSLYRSRRLSPVEVTRAILHRIDALNPKLNAYCLVDHDAAMRQARESERRWTEGRPLGLLDGVPASIKDLILTRGWPTLRGSRTSDPKQAWDSDAPATQRLREHGAVLLGKTATPEFGWKGLTDGPLTGVTRNPWNLDKTPGGSSGGASAQVAAGLGPLAVGTDGGGSIRIPCAFTGIFGIKPSFGRVPAWPASAMGTLAHLGPMTRTVADAALMLTVLAEPDARDWSALPAEDADYMRGLRRGVRGLKVAYSPRLGHARVDPEVAQLVDRAARAFEELGAKVEQVDPGFDDPIEIFWTLWTAGAWNLLKDLPPEKKALVEPGLMQCVESGGRIGLGEYMKAMAERANLGIRMRQFHERFDLLLTPALAVAAFDVGRLVPEPKGPRDRWTDWTPFSYPFNLTQQPACSVPCGFTSAGLPVGLQIVGPMFRDDLVLRAAQAYEEAHPTLDRKPAL